jgi:excisionase family DNA binding protein
MSRLSPVASLGAWPGIGDDGTEAWWHDLPMPAHLHPITSIATEETIPSGEETFAGRLALSVAEAAAALGVSRALVNQECATGRLHSVKIGQRRLIPVASLEAWLGIGHDDDGDPS